MDTITEGVLHRRAHATGDDPEKSSEKGTSEKIEVNSVEIDYADEALRLVGTVRVQSFSEEYNQKLRRKLVNPPVYSIMNLHRLTSGRTGTSCPSVRPYTSLNICKDIRTFLLNPIDLGR